MNVDMTNIAYTEAYQAERREADQFFRPDNLLERKRFDLPHGYSLERDVFGVGQYSRLTETRVSDATGREVYRYRNIDPDGDFCTLIDHSNGKRYLVFRTGLYGYGVYDFAAQKDFHYVPKAKESFIWTDVFYNSQNNMLAVEGCYWAYPYSMILLDFSDPMVQTKWVEFFEELDPEMGKYDDFNFGAWNCTTLELKVTILVNPDSERPKTRLDKLEIPESLYRSWLDKA